MRPDEVLDALMGDQVQSPEHTGALTEPPSAAPGFDDIFRDEAPVPAPDPIAVAASAALQACLTDHKRVRVQRLLDDLIAFVVTTKPTAGNVGPLVHAGVEPQKVIDASDHLVAGISPTLVVGDYEHRCWALRVGSGLLIRFWRRDPGVERNTRAAYWAVTPGGEVRRLDEVKYQRLRKAVTR